MIIWLSTLIIAFIFRVWAKTYERRMANSLSLSIYRGNNQDAILLFSSLIARPSPANELVEQIATTIPPFSIFFKLIYPIFAFSLVASDERNPLASMLLESEKDIYDLHDPDIYEAYRRWKTAFFWDGVSAGVFVLVILSLFSKTLFIRLYR